MSNQSKIFEPIKVEDYWCIDNCCYGKTKEDLFMTYVLKLCGCFSEDTPKKLLEIFKMAGDPYEVVNYRNVAKRLELPEWAAEAFLMLLNELNLFEHGGSCRNSWLTEYGKEVLDWMNT